MATWGRLARTDIDVQPLVGSGAPEGKIMRTGSWYIRQEEADGDDLESAQENGRRAYWETLGVLTGNRQWEGESPH